MNILVIGTGAIGSFYGSLLARQGIPVAVQARSDFAAVSADGIEVTSDAGLENYHWRPSEVVHSAAELKEPADYVLLCVKVAGVDRAGLLREAVGPKTAIVLISNGVEIEDEVAQAYPENELISGLASICVTRTAPGKIWHQAYGRLVLGNYPSGASERVKALADAIAASGIACVATDDIVTARWQKCVWNAAFSPISVLSGGLTTDAILATQEPFVAAIMDDVCRVAAALGHPLAADTPAKTIASTHKMPPYKTSMLLDFEAGRPMETEAILGNAVRAAHRAGVAAPYLESLYALLQLRERLDS